MDRSTKAYIDSLVTPLLARIQALETSNEELRAQVRHLQQLINHQPSYQRPTVSASQHMRESRLSSKGSQIKKSGWNINTKYESPIKHTNVQVSHQKIKTKPPIPKIMKSPPKPEKEDDRPFVLQKKITGGTRFPADNNQHQNNVENQKIITKSSDAKKQSSASGEKVSPNQDCVVNVEPINKFEQLVKQNTVLVQQMKQVSEKKQAAATTNLVLKAGNPKSEQNYSNTTSPNSHSFISEHENKKGLLQGLKINIDCGLAKIDIK